MAVRRPGVPRPERGGFMEFSSLPTELSLWSRDGSSRDRYMSRFILLTRSNGRLTRGDLEIAEPFVFDEFLRHHPCGCFVRGGKRLVLGTEDTSATNRFPHERCHGGFGAQGVTGHSRKGLQGDCGMIGIEFRVGRLLGVRSHSQYSRVMYGRYSKGCVEEGF